MICWWRVWIWHSYNQSLKFAVPQGWNSYLKTIMYHSILSLFFICMSCRLLKKPSRTASWDERRILQAFPIPSPSARSLKRGFLEKMLPQTSGITLKIIKSRQRRSFGERWSFCINVKRFSFWTMALILVYCKHGKMRCFHDVILVSNRLFLLKHLGERLGILFLYSKIAVWDFCAQMWQLEKQTADNYFPWKSTFLWLGWPFFFFLNFH